MFKSLSFAVSESKVDGTQRKCVNVNEKKKVHHDERQCQTPQHNYPSTACPYVSNWVHCQVFVGFRVVRLFSFLSCLFLIAPSVFS